MAFTLPAVSRKGIDMMYMIISLTEEAMAWHKRASKSTGFLGGQGRDTQSSRMSKVKRNPIGLRERVSSGGGSFNQKRHKEESRAGYYTRICQFTRGKREREEGGGRERGPREGWFGGERFEGLQVEFWVHFGGVFALVLPPVNEGKFTDDDDHNGSGKGYATEEALGLIAWCFPFGTSKRHM